VNDKKTNQAVSLLKEGKFQEALKLFNQLIEQSPKDPDLWSYKGTALLNLKKNSEALSAFNLAVKLDPDYSYRYASRAFAKDASGDLEGAISDYKQAIVLDPEDAIAHNNLGLLLEKQGNQSAAKKHFSNADQFANHFLGSSNGPAPKSELTLQPKKLEPDPKRVSQKMFLKQTMEIFSSGKEFRQFVSFIFRGFKQ
jgi:Flp pilus assembly protein TadD